MRFDTISGESKDFFRLNASNVFQSLLESVPVALCILSHSQRLNRHHISHQTIVRCCCKCRWWNFNHSITCTYTPFVQQSGSGLEAKVSGWLRGTGGTCAQLLWLAACGWSRSGWSPARCRTDSCSGPGCTCCLWFVTASCAWNPGCSWRGNKNTQWDTGEGRRSHRENLGRNNRKRLPEIRSCRTDMLKELQFIC